MNGHSASSRIDAMSRRARARQCARKVLVVATLHSPKFARRYQEGSAMAHPKQASKRKARRTTLPAFGAAGVSLAMAGSASAATAPTANAPSQDTAQHPVIFLGDEELSDVSLATFYVFDKENVLLGEGLRLAARGGCGGCGGCRGCAARGCGGCGGCAARGCAVRGCGGCAVRAFRGCGGCGGCRGCAVRVWRGCGGCGGCGCGCASCWLWFGFGRIWVC